MGIVIERKWRCESCDAIHDTEDSAIDCCPPTVHKVFLYPKCGSACDDEEGAIDCCDTDRDDIVSSMLFHRRFFRKRDVPCTAQT